MPGLTEREIELISDRLKDNPEIPHPGPYLQAVIGNGDAADFAATILNGHDQRGRHASTTDQRVADAQALKAHFAANGSGRRSEACKRRVQRERLDDAQPLAAIMSRVAQGADSRAGTP